MNVPVRLGPAELSLIGQLTAAGASAEAERLTAAGLPTRKVESYHYTDLKTLWRNVPPPALQADGGGQPPVTIAGAFPLAIVNGRVVYDRDETPSDSVPPNPSG